MRLALMTEPQQGLTYADQLERSKGYDAAKLASYRSAVERYRLESTGCA